MSTPNVSKEMRRIRRDRMDRAMASDSEQKRKEAKMKRLDGDYVEMRKVVDFFYNKCPYTIKDSEKQYIEKQLFNGKGSKNKHGTIVFLTSVIGCRWPEWEELAKKEFGIDY